MGEDDAGNEPCYATDDGERRLRQVGLSHRSMAEAIGTEKSCPKDCSGNGDCVMTKIATHEEVVSCVEGDLTCRGVCLCHNYSEFGGLDCSFTPSELSDLQQARVTLVNSIERIIATEDLTEDLIRSIVGMISEVGSATAELNDVSCAGLLRSINTTISYFIANSLSYVALQDITEIVSNCLNIYNNDVNPNTRDEGIVTATETYDRFTELVLRDLVSGQNVVEIIEDAFRQSIYVISEEESGQVVLTSPLTEYEMFRGLVSGSVTMIKRADVNTSVSAAFTERSGYLFTNVSQFVTNVMELRFSDPSAVIEFNFSLYTHVPHNFTDGEDDRVLFETQCHPQNIVDVNFTCPGPSQMNITHHCDGSDAHVLSSLCPAVRFWPTCGLILPGSIEENTVCKMTAYTNHSLTCSCLLDSSDRRRLSISGDSVKLVSLTEISSIDIYETFAIPVEPDKTEDSVAVVVFLSMLFVTLCIAVIIMVLLQKPTVHMEVLPKAKPGEQLSVQNQLKNYLYLVYPQIFAPKTTDWSTIWRELQSHHEYVWFFKDRAPIVKFRSGMHFFTTQALVFAYMYFFYNLQYPSDDDGCADFGTRSNCLEDKTVFDRGHSKCEWVLKNGFHYCQYREAELSVFSVGLIGILAAFAAALINYALDPLFCGILAGTTAKSKQDKYAASKEEVEDQCDEASAPAVTSDGKLVVGSVRVLTEDVINSRAVMTAILKETPLPEIPSAQVGNVDEEMGQQEAAGNKNMSTLILQQREIVSEEDTSQFDDTWMFDYKTGEPLKFLCLRGSADVGQEITALSVLDKEVEMIRATVENKVTTLHDASDNEVGMELCHLMVEDLLGRETFEAAAFRTKCHEDFNYRAVVTPLAKTLGWVAVAVINILAIMFVAVMATRRDSAWQNAFIVACFIQLFIDILITRTGQCLWANVAMPLFIKRDVVNALDVVYKMVEDDSSAEVAKLNEWSADADVLDVPKFAFVSTGVAARYTHLFESTICRSYHSPAGGKFSEHIQRSIKGKAQSTAMYLCSGAIFGALLFAYLSTSKLLTRCTAPIQKLWLHFLHPLMFWSFILLIAAATVVVGVAAVLIILIVYQVIVNWYLVNRQKQRTLSEEVRPLAIRIKPIPQVKKLISSKVVPVETEEQAVQVTPPPNIVRDFSEVAEEDIPPPNIVSEVAEEDISVAGQSSMLDDSSVVDDIDIVDNVATSGTKDSAMIRQFSDVVDASDGQVEAEDTCISPLEQIMKQVSESIVDQPEPDAEWGGDGADDKAVDFDYVEADPDDDTVAEQADDHLLSMQPSLSPDFPCDAEDDMSSYVMEQRSGAESIRSSFAEEGGEVGSVRGSEEVFDASEEQMFVVDDTYDAEGETVEDSSEKQMFQESQLVVDNTYDAEGETADDLQPSMHDSHMAVNEIDYQSVQESGCQPTTTTDFVIDTQSSVAAVDGEISSVPVSHEVEEEEAKAEPPEDVSKKLGESTPAKKKQAGKAKEAVHEELVEEKPREKVKKVPRRPRPADTEDTTFRPLYAGMGLVFGAAVEEEEAAPSDSASVFDITASSSMWVSPIKSSPIKSTIGTPKKHMAAAASEDDMSPFTPLQRKRPTSTSEMYSPDYGANDTSSLGPVQTPKSRSSNLRRTLRAIKTPDSASPHQRPVYSGGIGSPLLIEDTELVSRHQQAIEKAKEAKKLRVLNQSPKKK
jgi:hypothetical protein